MLKTTEDFETPVRIVEAVVKANDATKRAMGRKVIAALGEGEPRGKTAALLGLTFKLDTDDMRDAPSIAIVQSLPDVGVQVRAYDPEGMDAAHVDARYHVLRGSVRGGGRCPHPRPRHRDAFRALDLARLRPAMASFALVDLRNVYVRAEAEQAGFAYKAIGR